MLWQYGPFPTSMKRGHLAGDVMAAYRAPFAPPRSREPLHIFPHHILAPRDWLAQLWADLERWRGPAALVCPENDIAFKAKEVVAALEEVLVTIDGGAQSPDRD